MRRFGSALLLGAGAALGLYAGPALAVTPVGSLLYPTRKRLPVAGMVSLTFDDGPGPGTEQFLMALERAGARATFFLVGEQVAEAPSRAAEIIAAGHEVGVHCYRHRNHLRLTPAQVAEDLRRARDTIELATGRESRLYRPPYGIFNLGSWVESARQGWDRILWARWGRDWEARATPRSIADLVGEPRDGDIVLLHDADRYSAPDSWRNTLGALPLILERLAAHGQRARTVGELLAAAETDAQAG